MQVTVRPQQRHDACHHTSCNILLTTCTSRKSPDANVHWALWHINTRLSVCAVGDWEVCADTFYSREHLYDMSWQDVDLENKR